VEQSVPAADSPTPTEIKLLQKPRFSDGHDTRNYAWDYRCELGVNQGRLWAEYLGRLANTGVSRDSEQALTSTKSGVIWKK